MEDAAHALGTRYKGKLIGSAGTAMFSFHPIKNITTGEGGMLVTDEEELGKRCRSLKFHGLGVDAYDRLTHGRSPQAQVVEPGYKYNMPDMQAVLALGQLARIEESTPAAPRSPSVTANCSKTSRKFSLSPIPLTISNTRGISSSSASSRANSTATNSWPH